MKILQTSKSSANTLDVNGEAAVRDEAFATYKESGPKGVKHTGLGWRLQITNTEGRFKGNTLELFITPEEVTRLREALAIAEARFKET